MTSIANHNALPVGGYLGAAGSAVRPRRVSAFADGSSIGSSTGPCGRRRRTSGNLIRAVCAGRWRGAPSGRRKRTVLVDEALGFIAQYTRERMVLCPMAPAASAAFWGLRVGVYAAHSRASSLGTACHPTAQAVMGGHTRNCVCRGPVQWWGGAESAGEPTPGRCSAQEARSVAHHAFGVELKLARLCRTMRDTAGSHAPSAACGP